MVAIVQKRGAVYGMDESSEVNGFQSAFLIWRVGKAGGRRIVKDRAEWSEVEKLSTHQEVHSRASDDEVKVTSRIDLEAPCRQENNNKKMLEKDRL